MTPTIAQIPARANIRVEDTWDLSQLFADEAEYRQALEKSKALYPQLVERKGTLGRSARDLRDALELEKQTDLLSERLGHYVSLKTAEDSSNTANLARKAELSNLFTRIREATAFITPEIQQIPDEAFTAFLQDPVL